MTYNWVNPTNPYAGQIKIDPYPPATISASAYGDHGLSELPTDPTEVEALVRAILQATGNDIAAESDGYWGVIKLIGPPA